MFGRESAPRRRPRQERNNIFPEEEPSGLSSNREDIIMQRKLDKMRRLLDQRMNFPTNPEVVDAVGVVLGKLGEQLYQERITNEMVKEAERNVYREVEAKRAHLKISTQKQEPLGGSVYPGHAPGIEADPHLFMEEELQGETQTPPVRRSGSRHSRPSSRHSLHQQPIKRSTSRSSNRTERSDSRADAAHDKYRADPYYALALAQQEAQERAHQMLKEHEKQVKARTSEALSAQIQEHEFEKEARVREKQQELARVQYETRQWEEQERQRKRQERQKAQQMNQMFKSSADQHRRELEQARQRKIEEERRLLEFDRQQTEEAERRERMQKDKQRDHLRKMLSANEARMQEMERQKEKERLEEERLLREYEDTLRIQDQRRAMEIAKTHHQPRGSHIHVDHHEKLRRQREDDHRRMMEVEERDRREEEAERELRRRKRAQAQHTMSLNDEQVHSKKEQRRREREEAERERRRLERDTREGELKEQELKRKERQRQAEYRRQLDEQRSASRALRSRNAHPESSMHESYVKDYLSAPGGQSTGKASPTGLPLSTNYSPYSKIDQYAHVSQKRFRKNHGGHNVRSSVDLHAERGVRANQPRSHSEMGHYDEQRLHSPNRRDRDASRRARSPFSSNARNMLY